MKSIISVDPFLCRMWSLHDRLDCHVDENSCKGEIESFLKHGQLMPVLGRRLRADSTHTIELIYGARRLFVARHLRRPLLVEVREISDEEGIIAMDIENRHRLDISPYERGMSYLRWLRSGYFKSQDDIARGLRISASQVSRLLKLAQLPSAVVAAFPRPMDICEAWALALSEVLEDPQRRTATCARARALASLDPRPPAREIYRQLLSASVPGRKTRARQHDEIVTGRNGQPLYRIRQQINTIALLLPINRVSARRLTQIRAAVSEAMEGDTLPRSGCTRELERESPNP
jgi:ParB family transcriptional regulator, chromosome partitioning protein